MPNLDEFILTSMFLNKWFTKKSLIPFEAIFFKSLISYRYSEVIHDNPIIPNCRLTIMICTYCQSIYHMTGIWANLPIDTFMKSWWGGDEEICSRWGDLAQILRIF